MLMQCVKTYGIPRLEVDYNLLLKSYKLQSLDISREDSMRRC